MIFDRHGAKTTPETRRETDARARTFFFSPRSGEDAETSLGAAARHTSRAYLGSHAATSPE